MLSWLKRKTETAYSDGSFLHIPSKGYFGHFSTSPNQRFTLTWRDGDGSGRGGVRTSGPGSFFLLRDDTILAEGRCERPHDGKVADNGTFVLNDWLLTSRLEGVFRAFRANGELIVQKRMQANLYNNGLSADGRLAVCQTCNAPTPDGSMLTVFDLGVGKEVASWMPESGWAQGYSFADGPGTITLRYGDGGVFAYAVSGTFVDRERWISWRLARGDLLVVERLLDDSNGALHTTRVRELMAAIEVAQARSQADARERAWGWKLLGRCKEGVGDAHGALASYEAALQLDDKAGVKRRADVLRKRLGLM